MASEPVCEINRYVRQRPGRNSWWFRRRVPGDLIHIIGKDEWRFGLKARHRDDAVLEAIPHLAETNKTIELARRGDWPRLTNDEVALLSKSWLACCQDNNDGECWDEEPHFSSDSLYVVSITEFLSRQVPPVPPGTSAFQRVLEYGRTLCFINDGYSYRRGLLPLHWSGISLPGPGPKREPLFILHPEQSDDPKLEKDDLIVRWAYWRQKGKRSKYQMRKIVERFIAVTEINDLHRVTRQHVEDWIKHLREVAITTRGHRKGQRLSDPTVAAEFAHFRALCNLAVEKEWITISPCAKIKITDPSRKQRKRRSYTDAEARVVLEWARRQTKPYLRWLPWVCCFTGCRLDEVAGATVKDIEQVGPYWVLSIRLDHRGADASLKTLESERRVPLHRALVDEGFIRYVRALKSPDGSLFPDLHADRFGSKAAIATKRLGPHIRALETIMPTLADSRLSPSHSWRHRLHDEFRRLKERQDIEDAIIGHAADGSGPGYGEYAIIDMLGPAIDRTRSPLDAVLAEAA